MRTVKLIVLGLLAVILIILGVANMAAVDLHLLPEAVFGEGFSIKGLPLAVVILAAVLTGILAGLVIEFLREHEQRRVAEEKRREIVKLRQEVTRLRTKLGDREDDRLGDVRPCPSGRAPLSRCRGEEGKGCHPHRGGPGEQPRPRRRRHPP